MSFMMAFGLAGTMICLGMLLRAKISVLRNMLVPASVVAGSVLVVGVSVSLSSGGFLATYGALHSSGAVAVVSSGLASSQLAVSFATSSADSLVLTGSGAACVST